MSLIDQFVSVPTQVQAALATAPLTDADQPAPGDAHRCPIPVSENVRHTETARVYQVPYGPEDATAEVASWVRPFVDTS